MVRVLTMMIAAAFMSVTFAGSSFADSDSENKHDYKYEKKEKDDSSSKYGDRDEKDRSNYRNDPVSNTLNHVNNSIDRVGQKINQAREWWQFW